MTNNNITTLPQQRLIVKRRGGFFVFPDDDNSPITPDQIDKICDLYVEIHGYEPKRDKLAQYGRFTQKQASIKIEIFELIDRIYKDDPALRNVYMFPKSCEKRILHRHGYKPYKPLKTNSKEDA